jgi:hypothetical protein
MRHRQTERMRACVIRVIAKLYAVKVETARKGFRRATHERRTYVVALPNRSLFVRNLQMRVY